MAAALQNSTKKGEEDDNLDGYDDLPPDNKNGDKKISEPMTNVFIEVNPHKNMSENLKTIVMEQSIDRVQSFCGSTDIMSEESKHRPQPKNIAQARKCWV